MKKSTRKLARVTVRCSPRTRLRAARDHRCASTLRLLDRRHSTCHQAPGKALKGWLCQKGEAHLPAGEWRAEPFSEALAPGAGPRPGALTLLSRRTTDGGWRAELLIAPSELMRRAGAKSGRGLWSLRRLRGPRFTGDRGTPVGSYGGLIVARGPTRVAAAAAASPLARAGSRHLACVKVGREWLVLDGLAEEPLPCMHCMNDPHGTPLTAACRLAESGAVTALRRVPALDLQRPFRDQPECELSLSYGSAYWAVHD